MPDRPVLSSMRSLSQHVRAGCQVRLQTPRGSMCSASEYVSRMQGLTLTAALTVFRSI